MTWPRYPKYRASGVDFKRGKAETAALPREAEIAELSGEVTR